MSPKFSNFCVILTESFSEGSGGEWNLTKDSPNVLVWTKQNQIALNWGLDPFMIW